jgi:hypothetical protein
MEVDALRVLVIVVSVTLVIFLAAAIAMIIAVVSIANTITENMVSFSAGMSRLGVPVLISRMLFGIARRAFSKH